MRYKVRVIVMGSPNVADRDGEHWKKQSKAYRIWRARALIAAMDGKPFRPMVDATVTIERHGLEDFEPWQMARATEPIIEGLVEAGVLLSRSSAKMDYAQVQAVPGFQRFEVLVEGRILSEDEYEAHHRKRAAYLAALQKERRVHLDARSKRGFIT